MTQVIIVPTDVFTQAPVYTSDESCERELVAGFADVARREGRTKVTDMLQAYLDEDARDAWWRTHRSKLTFLSPEEVALWKQYMPHVQFRLFAEKMYPEYRKALVGIDRHRSMTTRESATFGIAPGGKKILLERFVPAGRRVPTNEEMAAIVAARSRLYADSDRFPMVYGSFVISSFGAWVLFNHIWGKMPFQSDPISAIVLLSIGVLGVCTCFGLLSLFRALKRWRFCRAQPEIAWAL